MGAKIRILLADDHVIVRMGIASAISFEDDMTVVGEAGNGQDAVKMADELLPDVVIMDLMMPKLNGTEATAEILRRHPDIGILMLTSFITSADLGGAIRAGARGALPKTSSQDEIIFAIRKIASGGKVIPKSMERDIALSRLAPELTARQIEVLRLASRGFTNLDIANILGISPNSVKDHMKLIFQRLGVSKRSEAVAIAMSDGVIEHYRQSATTKDQPPTQR